MFLLASAIVFLGGQAQRCSAAATPDSTSSVTLTPSMVPPRAWAPAFVPHPGFDHTSEAPQGHRRSCWNKLGASGVTAAYPRPVVSTRKVVVCAAARRRAGQQGEGAAAAAAAAGGEGAVEGGGAEEADGSASPGRAGRPRDPRSLQERLNNMSLDFSGGDREPYVAGAPRKTSPPAADSPPSAAAAAGEGETGGRRGVVRHSSYRIRKRPSHALCMPKYQRPQGCAPLLPMNNREAAVDHIAGEQGSGGKLSEFTSDLPCVKDGACPLPAFRCPKGHVWEANGSPVCFYCPVCADARVTALPSASSRQKRDLEVMQQLAEERGGSCLSDTYLGMHQQLRFQCSEGHEWLSTPSNLVYKNTWCPRCASRAVCERKKLTATDMHQTARQFGGEFLSPEYLGAAVKHEWRCHRGHRFWQTPNNVRRAEGGRRTATFCKKCTVMDKNILKASVLAGLGRHEAKRTEVALEETGAMPTRRYFLPRRAKGRRPTMPRRVRDRTINSGDGGSEPTTTT